MIFDIYGLLKDAYSLFVEIKESVNAKLSYSNAFDSALDDCRNNDNISDAVYHYLKDNKNTGVKKQIKKALNNSIGSRELGEQLFQILNDINFDLDEKEISCFLSRLFFYLLRTKQYSEKMRCMRLDSEILEVHQMQIKALNDKETMFSPRILTRYSPKTQEELVGREDDIENILKLIRKKSKIVIVNGMGGIGKTALCRFLFHNEKVCKQIAWVNYKGNLLNDLVEQFYYPYLNKESSFEERLNKLLFFLREEIKEDAFLFVDNINVTEVEDQSIHILNSFKCKVLCTSRLKNLGLFEIYDLDFLDESQCIEMFEYYYRKLASDDERNIVGNIVNLAGLHTLTIEAIAKVSLQDGLQPLEILEKLRHDGFNLSEAVSQITHRDEVVREETIINHLKYVYDVSSLNETELKVVKVLSLFPNMPVPQDIYKWFGFSNMNVFNGLANYAWLKKTDNGFFMHHVIKEVVKSSVKITLYDCKKVIDYFINYFEHNENGSVQVYNDILPYVEYVLEYFCNSNSFIMATLFCSIGQVYYYTGKYDEAKELLDKSYGRMSRKFSYNDKEIFSIFCIKASIENCVGNIDNSAILYEKAIKGCEASNYNRTVIMADIYRDAATNYSEFHDEKYVTLAIDYCERAIELYKINAKFLDLASTYNNLGLIHYYKGNSVKAMDYYFQAEELYNNRLPDNHQDFATLYNNMAMIFCDEGNFDKALEYHMRALNIRNKFRNENHIDLSQSYNNIATVFLREKNYEKAIEFQSLDIMILESISLNHVYLAESYKRMAYCYEMLGDAEKSKQYRKKAESLEENNE